MSKVHYNSSKNNNPIAPVFLMVVMLLILIIASISMNYITLSKNIQSTKAYTPTFVPYTATDTKTLTPTATITPTITTTPTLLLSTRSPNFVVGPWHDNSGECSSDIYFSQQVLIYGVEIRGGIPPYNLTFIQYGEIIEKRTIRVGVNGRVEFTVPIATDKGEVLYVEVSFMDNGHKIVWNGELFYPPDSANPSCPK